MEVSQAPETVTNLKGSRIGMLGFEAEMAEELGSALKSAECVSTILPTTEGNRSEPLEGYDLLIVWAGEDGPTPRVADLLATSQRWMLFGAEEQIRESSSLYLRADDVVFTPYSLNELLFRMYRTIHRANIDRENSNLRHKPTVLVADDDPEILMLLNAILQDNDWVFHFATNGRQALVMARTLLPDLLVLDIEMPYMTGLEVLRRVRRDAGSYRAKVLLLTASGEMKHVEEGLALGADDYVAKPFSPAVLVQRIKKLLASPGAVLPDPSAERPRFQR